MSIERANSWGVSLPAVYEDLSQEERKKARAQYAKLQHNQCWYCGQTLYKPSPDYLQAIPIDWSLFPPAFTKYPIHLQHNHETGLTEGAIHSFCNALIWNYFGR